MPDPVLTPDEIALNFETVRYVKPWLRHCQRTQVQLSVALDVTPGQVSKYLSGKMGMSLKHFMQIAAFLGAKPTDLMGSPTDTETTRRYAEIAEAAQGLEGDDLKEWLAIARRFKSPPS